MTALPKHTVTRLTGIAMAIALAVCALLAIVTLLPGGQPQPVLAAGVGVGSITHTLVSDFNVCTVLTGTVNRVLTDTIVSNADGGEIRLVAYLEDYFDGTSVDGTKWITGVIDTGINTPPVVGGGLITLSNSFVSSTLSVPDPGRAFEARARLQQPAGTTGFGDIGFGRQAMPGGSEADRANRLFITNNANALEANARDGAAPATNTLVSGVVLTQFHQYRIEWDTTQTRYYIDGAIYPTATINSGFIYTPNVWLYTNVPGSLVDVDWVRVDYYLTTTGQYASCAADSGQESNWLALTWTSNLPAGTSVALETRSSSNGSTWSSWSSVAASGSTIASPNGRYLQYRATLTTTDVNASPEIGSVIVGYELNEAPIANAGGPYTITEGALLVLSGALSSDPNSDPITYAWDLDNDGVFTDASGVTTTITFPDGPATQIIGLRVSDESGVTGTQTTTVTINNVNPTASTTGPYSGNEGSLIAFTGNFTDPGSADTHTFLWNFGDGSTSTSQSPSYAYADNGVYTAVFTTTDDDGGFGIASTIVTVTNVPPTATFNAPVSANEGSAFNLSLSSPFDPSSEDTAAGFTYAFDCGDGAGYGTFSSTSSANCPTTDNSVRSVGGMIRDQDGGTTEYLDSVTVANVAPSASTTGPYAANEGTTIAFTGTFTDPGSADTHSFLWTFGDGNSSTLQSPSYAYTDNGVYTAVFTTTDDDGGIGIASTLVTVTNVAPTASAGNNSPAAEGASINFTGNFSDPGSADTHSFLWNFGDGNSSTTQSPSYAYADSGSYTAVFTATDDDGGFGIASTLVTVTNVAPTASFTATSPINEGGTSALLVSGPSDPSIVDTIAGFHYSFACDGLDASLASTYAGAGTNFTAICNFADNGNYTVKSRIFDKDNGYTTLSTTVTVNNVAPTATFNTSGSVDEGDGINLSLTAPSDPSTVDMSAGFTYAFDCGDGSGYGSFSSANATVCTAIDDPSQSVKARIRDKDNGETEYAALVTVANVPPIASASGPYTGAPGSPITFSGVFTDAGSTDTHTFLWDFGDGMTSTLQSPSHAYAAVGDYTVVFTVTDDSGGIGVATPTIAEVRYKTYLPAILRNSSSTSIASFEFVEWWIEWFQMLDGR